MAFRLLSDSASDSESRFARDPGRGKNANPPLLVRNLELQVEGIPKAAVQVIRIFGERTTHRGALS